MEKNLKVQKLEHDKQTDAFNCGIFVCQFINNMILNVSLKNMKTCEEFWGEIKKNLIENIT